MSNVRRVVFFQKMGLYKKIRGLYKECSAVYFGLCGLLLMYIKTIGIGYQVLALNRIDRRQCLLQVIINDIAHDDGIGACRSLSCPLCVRDSPAVK